MLFFQCVYTADIHENADQKHNKIIVFPPVWFHICFAKLGFCENADLESSQCSHFPVCVHILTFCENADPWTS